MPSLAAAAASGCRKCTKELASGEKTRKGHDKGCPRKWSKVGGSWLKPPLEHTSKSEKKEESKEEIGCNEITSLARTESGVQTRRKALRRGSIGNDNDEK